MGADVGVVVGVVVGAVFCVAVDEEVYGKDILPVIGEDDECGDSH